ncbi:MAG TPA: hypothetical protein DDX39_06490 [Bacteroidales bacterium]|nr:MAG: hypothetical protein A2W98_05075 [Bacteroidetes bacterium GWF2_33_38]OFY90405.1 MAG: hypothetical protein A2236_01600 [Bacteroidetes bacterium RIFOXYA2_FULL_33_7]HBF88274.1 hypothetical protein [Bacteroidales bacterium]
MRKAFIFGLLLITIFPLYGQNNTDTIEVKSAPISVIFLQNGKKLTPRNLLEISASNEASYNEMKIAKRYSDIATVFGSAGGFMLGWQLGTATGGGEPNWNLAAVGAGLIVVSIPFSLAYTKHTRKAVDIYNNGLQQTGRNSVEFKFGLSYNGIGLRIRY